MVIPYQSLLLVQGSEKRVLAIIVEWKGICNPYFIYNRLFILVLEIAANHLEMIEMNRYHF